MHKLTTHSNYKKNLRLIVELAKRDLKTRYAGSYGGMLWHIGVPLIYTLINVIVFSMLMNGRMGTRYGNIPFVLFYLVPFSLWTFFAEVTGRSTNILRDYSYLINKIAFPFWILPLVPIAGAVLNQFIILIASILLMRFFAINLGSHAYVYIFLWIICCMITFGVSYAVSALSLYIPDLTQIVPITTNIIFWLTPILYSSALVSENGPIWVRNIIMDFNPFFYIVEMSRDAVFGTASIHWIHLLGLSFISLLCLAGGITLFHKLKSGFADVV